MVISHKCPVNVGTKTKEFFPKHEYQNDYRMNIRHQEEYRVIHTNTERFKNSTVPYIQRMLNRKSPFLV